MGFRKNWSLSDIENQIRTLSTEVSSPYNDGWTASSCKKELFQLKCFIEDQYSRLPKFACEDEWEQERLINILKK